jgi:type VI protein secretion system component Hcp
MKTRFLVLLFLTLLLVSASQAAYNMCLTAPGLTGTVTDRDHRSAVGVVGLKGPNKPGESGPLVIQKNLDPASNVLFAACLAGTVYPSLVIDVMQPVGGEMKVVTKITLRKAVVRGVELKYESALIEEVTLGYDAISWQYDDIAPDGTKRGSTTENWDNNTRAKF